MGRIFNIQHFSIHDGPGIRSVIFFKGCNLSCIWCHNPESISSEKSLMLYEEKCIGCMACFQNCPNRCHVSDEKVKHIIDGSRCHKCLVCSQDCYAEALVSVGEDVTVPFVLEAILSNKPYFANSGGGVTFSGGECMLQIDFLQELLMACKEKGIHTAVDTAGHVPWSFFERILPYTDLFLYDIKAFDPTVHQQLTGVVNSLILDNFIALYDAGADIHVRIPYIKGCNDCEMEKISGLLQDYPKAKVEILPYHSLGNSKYTALGEEQTENQNFKPLHAEKEEITQVETLFHI